MVQLRWQQAGQPKIAFVAIAAGKGSVALPVGVVSFDSGVIGLGFEVFCSGPAVWLVRLLATLFAMLETISSVLSC